MNVRSIKRGAFALLALCLLFLQGAARAQQPYNLGISVSANGYNERAWADMFKSDARVWQPGTSTDGPVDANGYPTTDFDLFTLDGGFAQNIQMYPLNGTYKLHFTGQATVTANGGTLQNVSYNAGTNVTTADLVVSASYPTISFAFRNTKRTSGSATNTGVTGLKLMRPVSIGSATSYASNVVFTTEYLAAHNRGNVLRSMDFVSTNGNIQAHWSDRNLPGNLCYYSNPGGYGWQGKGAPWEQYILLCNTLNKDCWVNIPLYADDNYIQQLATLLKNNLNSNLKIYVEYSNEIWNFGFAQFGQVRQLAIDEVNRGGSNLNYDGSTSDGDWTVRLWARRIKESGDIFRSVFGDAAMMTRVRPLFETQQSWDTWLARGTVFLDNYYNNTDGNHVATPHPVNYYLWGGGGSAYDEGISDANNTSDTLTINDVFNTVYPSSWQPFYDLQTRNVQWTSAFGLKRVAYESGPGIDGNGHSDPAKQGAQVDARIKAVYKTQADTFFKAGGDLFIHFLGINSTHGLVPYDAVIGSQPTYKQQAFDELMAAAARPAPTFGFVVPATINAGRYHVSSDTYSTGNSDNPVTFNPSNWLSYTLNVASAGSFTIQLNAVTGAGSGQARVEVDGNAVGTLNVPGAGTVATGSLSAGIHAIRIVDVTGSYQLQSLIVTSGGTPVVANPTFSPVGGTYASAQSVTISTTTSGASIRYTTNGSAPTSTTGTLYSGPVSVASSLTLKAIAYKSGSADSSVTSAAYTINAGGGSNNGTGLRGSYFNTVDLSGAAALVRTDPTVNFDFGSGSYASGQPVDNFSARWDGQVEAPVSGTYTFTTSSDDGVRLWVNGVQIINNWTDHAPTDNSGTIALSAGTKYAIKMEFYEKGGGAVAKLDWAYPGQARQNVPQTRLYPAGSAPAAPTGLSATAGNAQISLSWSAVSGATSYNVKLSTTNGGPYTTVSSPTGTSFTNTGLTNGTTYYYVVTALNANGESANSNQASATPVGGGGGTNLLANPGFETGALSGWVGGGDYRVNTAAPRSGSYNGFANGGYTSLFQNVQGLQPNTSYTFTIYARLTVNDVANPIYLFVRNQGGTRINKTVTTTGYQAYSLTFTTGAGVTSAEVGVECQTGAAVGAYLDDGSVIAN